MGKKDSDKNNDTGVLILALTILFSTILLLGLVTWVLYEYRQKMDCIYAPNIQCADDYICGATCTSADGANVNPCYANFGATGLSSCLMGPTSQTATICYNPQPSPGPNCPCTNEMTNQTNNCLSGCPGTSGQVNPNTNCCLKSNPGPNCTSN